MKTLSVLGTVACLGFSGCYTQLYTGGYASRTVEAPAEYYAHEPQSQADTLSPGDSVQGAGTGERDTAARPNTVVVNNYYRESPYYRGYLVDEWEYPSISFGFYSSRYRDYNGAYWWNDRGYHRRYQDRYYRDRDYGGSNPSYPSAGGGAPGPYKSEKRLFSNPPQRVTKGHRSQPAGAPAPAPKKADEGDASKSGNAAASPPASQSGGSDSDKSASEGSGKDDHPQVQKGKRR